MSEENFELEALQNVATGIGVFDVIGTTITLRFLNSGYYQMVGQPREERKQFLGNGTVLAVHPDDRAGLLAEALASIREKRVFSYRFRVLNGQGTYVWIGINANHRRINETAERFYAVYYNLDDLVQKQTALERYGRERDAILDKIPGGVAIFSYENNEIRLTYTSPGFYELHHGSRAFWVSQSPNPVDWLAEQDRALFLEEFEQVSSGKKPVGNVAYRIVGEDKKLHWVNNQFRSAYVENGVSYYYASFVDLDSQKEAEDERFKTKRMYEAAVEEAKLVVWEYDITSHRIVMAQNEFTAYDYRKFGLPQVIENVPQNLLPYIDEAYHEPFLAVYKAIENGAPKASCEVWYKLKPGVEPRCERISYTTVFDASGKPVKAFGIGQNITARKRQEEEYERMQNQFSGNLSDTISSVQFNLSKNLYLNGYSPLPDVEQSLKRATADDHFAVALQSVVDPQRKKELAAEFNCVNLVSLFEKGVEQFNEEYLIRSSKGKLLWIRTIFKMMQNPHTGDIEGVSFAKDVTNEKENESILTLLTKEGYDFIGIIDVGRSLFTMHDGIWKCSELSNGQSAPLDTVREQLILSYVIPSERNSFLEATQLKVLLDVLNTKGVSVLSYDYREGEGQPLLKKQISFRFLSSQQEKILVLQQDVTEAYKKDEARMKELEDARERADAANLAKTEFLSQMSHDIRTPLNGIIGMSYLASEQNNPPETVDCLKKIDTSSKYLLSLINDILDMSKAESNKIELHLEPYPLSEFNSYIESLIKPLCQAKDQRFSFNENEAEFQMVPLADKLRCNQIVFNLLSNAVKYTPEGGSITYSIFGRLISPSRIEVTHKIQDNGIGMSEEFQKHLFQPFTQENRMNLPEAHGTGLGLAIVKKLVEAMGGTIKVDSAIGKGSTFTVVLAFDAIEESKIPAKPSLMVTSAKDLGLLKGKRILLCEDNALNQEIAKALLSEKGILVEIAGDGKAGLDAFAASSIGYFDGVLMDVHMPIMDGYEATRKIRLLSRKDAKTVPIIAMTADAFAEDVEKALSAGMNGHIAKPIDPRQVLQTLLSFLG